MKEQAKALPARIVRAVANTFDFYGDGPTPAAVAYAAREKHFEQLTEAIVRNVGRQRLMKDKNAS